MVQAAAACIVRCLASCKLQSTHASRLSFELTSLLVINSGSSTNAMQVCVCAASSDTCTNNTLPLIGDPESVCAVSLLYTFNLEVHVVAPKQGQSSEELHVS